MISSKLFVCGALFHLLGGYAVSSALANGETPKSIVHTVEIIGFEFVPDKLTIRVGDTVRWVNKDIAPHTATASKTNSGEAWDSGRLNRLESWRFTANTVGETSYICTYHPMMKASITVKN